MSNKNCAFTIVAKNYIGLAMVLEKSIKEFYSEIDFFIVVADELNASEKAIVPNNVILAKDILPYSEDEWYEMAFKYNLTEFCTAIKPASILHFFDEGYAKAIYLDPDILFFSSIKPILDELNSYNIILTPHILTIPELGETDSPENDWLNCGIYNLGFCGVKNSPKSIKILKWWKVRLFDHCFIDGTVGEYTDQIWINFLPAFLSEDELLISRDFGRNVAPWNFFERNIVWDSGKFYVRLRNGGECSTPLMFVHFSGYDYKSLINGNVLQKNIANMNDYEDIKPILKLYGNILKDKKDVVAKYFNFNYSYSKFENGSNISIIHRQLFRAVLEHGLKINRPFTPDSVFYKATERINLNNTKSDSFNKISRREAEQKYKSKITKLNNLFRVLYKIIGPDKFFLMIRVFSAYRRQKDHFYLIDKYF